LEEALDLSFDRLLMMMMIKESYLGAEQLVYSEGVLSSMNFVCLFV